MFIIFFCSVLEGIWWSCPRFDLISRGVRLLLFRNFINHITPSNHHPIPTHHPYTFKSIKMFIQVLETRCAEQVRGSEAFCRELMDVVKTVTNERDSALRGLEGLRAPQGPNTRLMKEIPFWRNSTTQPISTVPLSLSSSNCKVRSGN